MELRKRVRYPVHFKNHSTSGRKTESAGLITDLSPSGCRVSTMAPMKIGTRLRMRFTVPNRNTDVVVRVAEVRWAHGMQFGVEFLEMAAEDSRQFQRILRELRLALPRRPVS